MNISTTYNKTEFLDKCRICLFEKGTCLILSLYGKDNIDIRTLYATCTGIKVEEQDNMPNSLCVNCLDGLIAAHNFIVKCKISDTFLHSLENICTSTEPTGYKAVMIDGVSSNINMELKENSAILEEVIKEEVFAIELDMPESVEIFRENQSSKTEMNNIEHVSTSLSTICSSLKQEYQDDPLELNHDQADSFLNHCDNSWDSWEWEEPPNLDLIQKRLENSDDQSEVANNVEHKTLKVLKPKVCEVCSKGFKRNTELIIHMRSHTKEKPYNCSVCSAKFSFSGHLLRHKRIHTGERPYVCSICGKGFIESRNLKVHEQAHSGVNIPLSQRKRILCSYCGLFFNSNKQLTKHLLNKHGHSKLPDSNATQNKLPYVCNICGCSFTVKYLLNTHIMSVHNSIKDHLCSYCGKAFTTKAGLDSHSVIHTGERPYKCETCSKTFAQSGSLAVHRYVHTGARKYSCDICDKPFKLRSHLNRHSLLHTGERNHSCTYCGKTFALKENLKQHTRIHTNVTPYHCSYCNKCFRTSNNLRKHLKIHERQKLN